MTRKITILITRRLNKPSSTLPCLFYPGAGIEGAEFKVIACNVPGESELSRALIERDDCLSLLSYDARTGVGYFQLVDSEAPEAGELIEFLI